jgi:hypothetical protein
VIPEVKLEFDRHFEIWCDGDRDERADTVNDRPGWSGNPGLLDGCGVAARGVGEVRARGKSGGIGYARVLTIEVWLKCSRGICWVFGCEIPETSNPLLEGEETLN